MAFTTPPARNAVFNWFRRKKDDEALRSLFLITEFTNGMDRFYASRGSDKSKFPLDTQIIMFSENVAYYAFQQATGKQDLARDGSIYEQVATNLLANQAALMLINLAYPKGHEAKDISKRGPIIFNNITTFLMDDDYDNPSDKALGMMSMMLLMNKAIVKHFPDIFIEAQRDLRAIFNGHDDYDRLIGHHKRLTEIQQSGEISKAEGIN